jgi:hypothetical protein
MRAGGTATLGANGDKYQALDFAQLMARPQLDGDGHTVHDADSAAGAIAKLSAYAVDVLLLGELQRPADSPALLRAIRTEAHTRIHPAPPVITLGNADALTALRERRVDTANRRHRGYRRDGEGPLLLARSVRQGSRRHP